MLGTKMEEAIVPHNRLHFIKPSASDCPQERRVLENKVRRELNAGSDLA